MKLLVVLLLFAAAAAVLCSAASAPGPLECAPAGAPCARAFRNVAAKDAEDEDDDEISLGSIFSSIFGFFSNGFKSIFGGENEEVAQQKESKAPPKYTRVLYKHWRLLKATPRSQDQLDEMNTIEEDFDKVSYWKHPSFRNESCDFIVPPGMMDVMEDFLRERQISYEIVTKDLQKMIEAANPRMTKERRDALKNEVGHSLTWRRYHRYTDILGYMDYLKRKYPDMVSVIKIGKSTRGLSLRVLKISTGPAENATAKPAIWIDGGTHAREWISPAVATYIMKQLVEYSKTNQLIVNSFDWYIMPVLNPDGYEYSHTSDRLWRKTRSKNKDDGRALWGDLFNFCGDNVGVDPNRNWDFQWSKQGASDSPCSDTYAGPKAFSEPEVKAVADFLLDNMENMKFFLTFHSFGQMWLLPWSYTSERVADFDDLMSMGKKATDAIANVRGTKYKIGSTTKLLYHSAGSADDWAKAVAGIKYAYTVELPDKGDSGFLLPASEITPTGKETFAGIKAMTQAYVEQYHPSWMIAAKRPKPAQSSATKPKPKPASSQPVHASAVAAKNKGVVKRGQPMRIVVAKPNANNQLNKRTGN
ncbi:Hypothetical predicted protein [Cloeon dipterum]|uniref:Peptidase M14 domain-containing protein n=1 Tax=Cloeon dipterum TaxID=197152 RepID=A0A8S1D6U2_9INSE|nr:Hypothetical predicted protein [Cloeon dipterum]